MALENGGFAKSRQHSSSISRLRVRIRSRVAKGLCCPDCPLDDVCCYGRILVLIFLEQVVGRYVDEEGPFGRQRYEVR